MLLKRCNEEHLLLLAYMVRYWMGSIVAGSMTMLLLRLAGRSETLSSEMTVDERAKGGRPVAAREPWRPWVLEGTAASSSWTSKRIRSGTGSSDMVR